MESSEHRIAPGFYDEPRSELSEIAAEALDVITSKLGPPESRPQTKVMVLIMQLTDDSVEVGDDGEISGEEAVGAAFSGFFSPLQMAEHLLLEVQNMFCKLGVHLSVETTGGPRDFSQN